MNKKLIVFIFGLLLVVPFGLATHSNGACEETSMTKGMVVGSDDPDYHGLLMFSSDIPDRVKEGQTFSVRTHLEFDGNAVSETLTLEEGMYPSGSSQVLPLSTTLWTDGGLGVNPTRNCVESEDFVDTVHIDSSPSGAATVTMEITAPVDASLNDGGERSYKLQSVLFKNCYRQCKDSTGSQPITWHSEDITLVDNPELDADTNSDGVQNGEETDLDCGGPEADSCPAGFTCEKDSDCSGSLVCKNLGSGKVCASETAEGGSNLPAWLGAFLILAGIIVGIVGIVWSVQELKG